MATPKKEVPKVEVKDEKVKYRCDFKSWDEYSKYTGNKA